MTYLGFHALFTLPAVLVLAWLHRRRRPAVPPRAGVFLIVIAVIALVYTTPWDNYLVWRGVWSYGAERVVGTIGYVPIEEYLFFVLQPLLTGLWFYRVLGAEGRRPSAGGDGAFWDVRHERRGAGARGLGGGGREGGAADRSGRGAQVAGAVVYALVALLGALLLRTAAGTYLGLILAWAGPVLALQWAYAGGEIWRRRRAFALGVAVPTVYLWIADAIAIHLGIWRISERYTLGPALGPLPLEEAVFFLVTNLLVVQGLILLLHPPRRASSRAAGEAASAAG